MANLDIAERTRSAGRSYRAEHWWKPCSTYVFRSCQHCSAKAAYCGYLTEPWSAWIQQVGMPAKILTEFREMIRRPHGIVLVTGPTGPAKPRDALLGT